MPKTIRLTDKEQDDLRKKGIEINKLLVKKGREPLRDSELVHLILGQAIDYIEVSESGNVRVIPD